ncbi:MAG TPA: TetR/AcrR family transcriptional regulator [Polyangiaceae bacterium]|jgi:AcrR family transcriptional regulator|nr:TetR/AcrR family transcriptional regulator [Polyangiaceae bacterium]
MPAPAKTSDDDIVRAARRIVERDGPEALSMQAVADAVGVRAPSLYKRFPHKDALLDAVARQAIAELRAKLQAASRDGLVKMAHVYRAFAKRWPGLYALLFTARDEAPDLVTARAQAVAPVLAVLATVVDAPDRLHAARLLTAYIHGFVSMELAGAFRLGGDVQAAFDFGIETLVRALKRRADPRESDGKDPGTRRKRTPRSR